MSIDLAKFRAFCERLTRIDFFGEGRFRPPWTYPPTPEAVLRAIESGAADFPPAYRNGYVAPLMANIQHVLLQTGGQLEPYAGVVYQYAEGSPVAEPLHRFLAVISDLYRSFLDKSKRAGLDLPLVTQLPPLALFESASGGIGPYTIPSDDMWNLITSSIGLVSLPNKYQDHPMVWASLAHETGGHDVLHADYALLPELKQGVWKVFGAKPPDLNVWPPAALTPEQLNGLVWSHWMDEAASDVYGLLNIGPQFAINLAAYFSALSIVGSGNAQAEHPFLGVDCLEENLYGQNFQLEAHPPDVLRLHLAIGVIGSLSGLDEAKRNAYIQDVETLSNAAAPDPQKATPITLRGYASYLLDDSTTAWYPVSAYPKLADMRESARRVGAYIATSTLYALGNNSVQKIETWDNSDDAAATNIAESLKRERRVDGMGDDAQLLAGADAAVVDRPDLYDQVSRLLEMALDRSFREDPIWRPSSPPPPSSSFSAPRSVFGPRRLQMRTPPIASPDHQA